MFYVPTRSPPLTTFLPLPRKDRVTVFKWKRSIQIQCSNHPQPLFLGFQLLELLCLSHAVFLAVPKGRRRRVIHANDQSGFVNKYIQSLKSTDKEVKWCDQCHWSVPTGTSWLCHRLLTESTIEPSGPCLETKQRRWKSLSSGTSVCCENVSTS